MNFPGYKDLKVGCLQRLFDKMSESYKIFWFKAIIDTVKDGRTEVTYDSLINKMISEAWYMVSEYRLNLGPCDTLEALVRLASEKFLLKSSVKKEEIIKAINLCDDVDVIKMKKTLTYNVPYRLQAPFCPDLKGEGWSVPKLDLARRINNTKGVIYRFETIDGLNSTIVIDGDWVEYFRKNYEIVSGWINFNMINYLQRRNPNVPGISKKIFPPEKEALTNVTKLWISIMEVTEIKEIYSGCTLNKNDLSIDHFVPWSYVAHDELWNLSPTTKSINSKKSNRLPDWDTYFNNLCTLEYDAYGIVTSYDKIHKEFDRCANKHINSDDVKNKLFRPDIGKEEFRHNLKEVIHPVYESAQNMGFGNWILS